MSHASQGVRTRRRFVWGAAAAAAVLLFCLAPQALAQETFEGRVAKLLEEGWGASIKSLNPAQEHFEAAEQLGGDHRAKLAMMLTFLKHRRYAEVEELAGQLLENDPASVPAREARIWVQMLNKKYPAALVEMETLAKNLPENASAAEEENIAEAAQFMGRLIGYLEGPAGDTLGKNQSADAVKKIESLLVATGRREAFAEGRKRVADQHAGVTLDSEQLKADEKESEEKRKAAERDRLAKEKANIGENKAEIDDLASKATRETTEAVAELDKQMAPLNAQFARLSGEAARVQTQIANLDLELGRVLQLVQDSRKDPVQQAIWLREADRIRIIQGQYQSQYAGLNAEAVRVNTQRASLDQQRRTKIANYEADMKRLGKQAQVLSRTEKRINQDEKKAERPATGNTSKVQSSNAKAAALSSYVDYPLERQRQRVLDTLKAKPASK